MVKGLNEYGNNSLLKNSYPTVNGPGITDTVNKANNNYTKNGAFIYWMCRFFVNFSLCCVRKYVNNHSFSFFIIMRIDNLTDL